MIMMSFKDILKMVESATLSAEKIYWEDEILDSATKIYMKQMELLSKENEKEFEKENKRNKMYEDIIASIDAGRRK